MNDVTFSATPGIAFELDDAQVTARPGETLWEVAQRTGMTIPHLCHRPQPGYRPDGNCRACMVEIEGERVLAASCIRKPTAGMKVKTQTDRAKTARRMVAELLLADQPAPAIAHDPESEFWKIAKREHLEKGRFASRPARRSAYVRPRGHACQVRQALGSKLRVVPK